MFFEKSPSPDDAQARTNEDFADTPLGAYAKENNPAVPETDTATETGGIKPIDLEIDGETIRLAPRLDGSFVIYIENCMFSAELVDGKYMISNITPQDRSGGYKAPQLEPYVRKAISTFFHVDEPLQKAA